MMSPDFLNSVQCSVQHAQITPKTYATAHRFDYVIVDEFFDVWLRHVF